MKKFIIAVSIVAALTGAAFADYQICHTNCWTDLNGNQHCTTTCY